MKTADEQAVHTTETDSQDTDATPCPDGGEASGARRGSSADHPDAGGATTASRLRTERRAGGGASPHTGGGS